MGRIRKRYRQFIRALFSGMDAEDYSFVDEFLNETEKKLFYQTDPAIQKHCVNVARDALNSCPGGKFGANSSAESKNMISDTKLLIKTSLLHDVGKVRGSFTLLDRVIYVIFSRLAPGLTKTLANQTEKGPFRGLRYAFYVHLNHEKIGAEILAKNGVSKDIVFLVANHHNKPMSGQSELLSLLIESDELN